MAFCVAGDRSIFLDVEADRYFGLKTDWDRAFRTLVAEGIVGPQLPALVEAGIIIEDETVCGVPKPASIPNAAREIAIDPLWPISALGFKFIGAQIQAIRALRRQSFASIINRIADQSRNVGPIRAADFETAWKPIVSAFFASSPLRPKSDHCFTNSIAFMRVVQSLGLKAELVFGVCPAPFSAHCWVQAGDHILSDRLENIKAFEPILAI